MSTALPPGLLAAARGDLSSYFDKGTLARGRVYFEESRVSQLAPTQDGMGLTALVKGSRHQSYFTMIRTGPSPNVRPFVSSCSCPMQRDCKHVVAVLLKVGRSAGPRPTSAWEALLEPFTRGTGGGTATQDLAVVLDWAGDHPLPTDGDPVPLKLVRRTAAGRWAKSGIGWSSLRYDHKLAVSGARTALQAVADAARPAHSYGYDVKVHLATLGARAPALLRDVAGVGVALLGADGEPVELSASRVDNALDVRRHDDGALSLSVTLDHDGDRLDPAGVRLLGDPPALLLRRREGRLVIAPLAPLDPDLRPLLSARVLNVPASSVPRFLTHYYPALTRRVTLSSADHSWEPPDPPSARLRLTATYDVKHQLGLTWSFVYDDAVLDVEGDEAIRDAAAEARLIADAVAILDRWVPGVVWRTPGRMPRPYSPSYVIGTDTATLTLGALPEVAAHPEMEVVTKGEAVDYRRTDSAPTLTVGMAEGEGTDWFDLEVSVEIDGEPVPFRPLFAALACGDTEMLLDSGTWFSLDRPELDQLRRLIDEADLLRDGSPRVRLSRWQAGLWDDLVSLAEVAHRCQAWEEAIAGLRPAASDPERGLRPAPSTLHGELRPYQLDGYRWLSYLWTHRLGGVLADDMGLGKTVQVLSAIAAAKLDGRLDGPVLVVAPTSVLGTWEGEAARFTPSLRVLVVPETAVRRGAALAETLKGPGDPVDVVVTSYAIVRLDAEDFQGQDWAAVFLDEAQYVKNARGKTHQVVRSLRTPARFAVTGTPLENSLMDVWAMMSLVAPGLFPDAAAFTEHYRRPIESGADPDRLALLQRRMRPLMLRRTKESVAPELPPKQEQTLVIALDPAHRRIYDRHLQRERKRVLGMLDDFERNRVAILTALTKLRQLALSPSLVDPAHAKVTSAKIDAFLELIQEVAAEGHRALVFSQFTSLLAIVKERLDAQGVAYSYLDGRTRDRQRRVAAFREGSDPVFLISLKAGGVGLTLTEADYVFVLDPWWNPAAENQAVDRTHRIGQSRTVMVYRLIAQDTIEEKVLALQQRKRDLFARVIDGGGAVDGMLTAEDIRGLLD